VDSYIFELKKSSLLSFGGKMKIIKIFTIFVLFGLAIFNSCAQKDILSKKSLKNLTYQNESANFGKATLKDGTFIESAAPGSASKTHVKLSDVPVYGTIRGKRAAAVILVTNSPGSGVFYDLAVITEDMNTTDVIPAINLGDRIKVNSITFKMDTIVVDIYTQAQGEPMVEHSAREVRKFLLDERNNLQEVKNKIKAGNTLLDIEWKLVRVAYANATEKMIKQPEKYLLLLSKDKKVNILADCNRGFGSYVLDGASLSINILGTTRAMCAPQSFSEKYIRVKCRCKLYIKR